MNRRLKDRGLKEENSKTRKNAALMLDLCGFIWIIGIFMELYGFIRIYWDLLGFIGIYWDLLGFMIVMGVQLHGL